MFNQRPNAVASPLSPANDFPPVASYRGAATGSSVNGIAANPPTSAYAFGAMRAGRFNTAAGGTGAGNTFLLSHQQQLQQQQEEQRVLSERFRIYEKGLAKIRLMWAEVLHICPETSALAAAGATGSKSLVDLRDEAEYYNVAAPTFGAAPFSVVDGTHRPLDAPTTALVEGIPNILPSYPLSSADSYDVVREVMQRWTYRVGGVGLRNPLAHLHYVHSRTPKTGGSEEGEVTEAATSNSHVLSQGAQGTAPNSESFHHHHPEGYLSAPKYALNVDNYYSHRDFLNLPIGKEPTVSQLTFIQEEIKRLQFIHEARIAVEEAVAVREGFVFHLQRVLADYTALENAAQTFASTAIESEGVNFTGLNDDRTSTSIGNSATPFLQIESDWRAGVEMLVQQLDTQVRYLETGGDPSAAFGEAFHEELRRRMAEDELAIQNNAQQQQMNNNQPNNEQRFVAQAGRQRLVPRVLSNPSDAKGTKGKLINPTPSEPVESAAAAMLNAAVASIFSTPVGLGGSAAALAASLYMTLPPLLNADDNNTDPTTSLLSNQFVGVASAGINKTKAQQISASLRGVREQLGALLVAKPPMVFGSQSAGGEKATSASIVAVIAPNGGQSGASILNPSSPTALTGAPKGKVTQNALRKVLKAAIQNLRRSSFDVVKAIEKWRMLLLEHPSLKEYNRHVFDTARAEEKRLATARMGNNEDDAAGGLGSAHPYVSEFDHLPDSNNFNPLAPPKSAKEYYAVPIYFWRGSSYLAKMSSDLDFLEGFLAPLAQRGAFVDKVSKAVGSLVMRELPAPAIVAPSLDENGSSSAANNTTTSAKLAADPLHISAQNFSVEYLRLRKAQIYVLKQLQRQFPLGFYVREAVATALSEALEYCDVSGNPFLNPSRKSSTAGKTLAPSWNNRTVNEDGQDTNDDDIITKYLGVESRGGAGDTGGYTNISSFYMGTSAATNKQAIRTLLASPMMRFFSTTQREAIITRWVEKWIADSRKGGGTSANAAASLAERSSGLPTTMSKGVPDILKFNSSTVVRSYFNDNSDARKDVRPETYLWAEGVLLEELLALGRQLSMTPQQRLLSATCLQQQVLGIKRGQRDGDSESGGTDQTVMRSHQFDRLSRYNAVLRHKEAMQEANHHPTQISGRGEGEATEGQSGTMVPIVIPNTTARGVFVRPQTLAALEAECAGIIFNSGVCDIQYDMFSVFDPSAKPGNDALDGSDDPDAARQVALVLRRMGRNDPTLAAHLRIMASRKAALKAQNERDAFAKSIHESNGRDSAKRNNSAGGHIPSKASSSSSVKATSAAKPNSSSISTKPAVAASGGRTTFGPSSVTAASLLSGKVGARTSAQIIRAAKKQFDRLETEEERETFASIVRIQAVWRGKQGRRLTKALHALNTAARSIQSVQKCKEAKDTLRLRKLQYNSARKIQSLVRGAMARNHVHMLRMVIAAAITIQRYYRGYKGRVLATKKRQIAESATNIQRVFRGHEDRQFAAKYKSEMVDKAATQIQRIWRGGSVRSLGTGDVKRINAAIRIQTCWRRYRAVQEVQRLRQLHANATKITSLVRAGYARHTVIRAAEEERAQALARGLENAAAAQLASLADETFELPEGSRYRR